MEQKKEIVNPDENKKIKGKSIEYFLNLQPGQKLTTQNGITIKFSRYWQDEDEMGNKVNFIYGFVGKKEYWWHKDGTPKFFKDAPDLTLIMPETK